MKSLRERVYSALDIAINENEYSELKTAPATRVAVDLTSYDADLEGEDVAEVAEMVIEYKKDRR